MHKTLQEAACRTIRAQSSGGTSGKVRRLNSGSRSSVMATSDGGGGERERRKRRAWRQPRHEAGSPPVATSVTATTTEPGASASRAVDTAPMIVGSAARTVATDTSQSLAGGARNPCSLTAGETKDSTKEEKRQRDDAAAQLLPEPSSAGGERSQDSIVEIDGSAMEGVGNNINFTACYIAIIIAGGTGTEECRNSGLPCATGGACDKGQRRTQQARPATPASGRTASDWSAVWRETGGR